MAKGYWIGRVDVTDAEAYQNYVKTNAKAFEKFGGKFLVRGGDFVLKEGEARSRNVVLEFPDYQSALACYESPEYAQALTHRLPAAIADIIVIEGYDG